MIDLAQAILALRPGARVSISNEDINRIVWNDGNPTNITNAEILTKQTELQAAFDALNYSRTRASAYPEIATFMEAYTEKEIGGDSTKWDAYVISYNKVRTDNPKP